MPLSELYGEGGDPSEFCRRYFEYFASRLSSQKLLDSCNQALDVFKRVAERGGRIFFCGNGGSASTANHFAADLGNNTQAEGFPPFVTESLCCNEALVTAIGNDYGYENIFTRQLETQLSSKDVVVAISASGNSPNVLNAIRLAKEYGAETIGLTGFDGGQLKQMVDVSFHADFEKGEYGPVEDYHLMLNHYLVTAIRLQRLGHP